jgi:glycosyltransferase involved in cell wall biosynthesis
MDELSQFRFAPADLREREEILLASADVVFTGGYGLFEAKSRLHDNVHFFGCGVDAAHFGRARRSDTPVAADVAELPRPVFGYFGVIDERIDYDLLYALAAERPDGSLVMVGPVVKVDWGMLPQAPNIHWLGQRAYDELPGYVKAFDVCLMPFALNEATEYINPTKTLEYMAAGKPIVSTPVADVVRNFAPVVRIAGGEEEFVRAVATAAEDPDEARCRAGIALAAESSWESIVRRMSELIADAVAAGAASAGLAEVALDEVLAAGDAPGPRGADDSTSLSGLRSRVVEEAP